MPLGRIAMLLVFPAFLSAAGAQQKPPEEIATLQELEAALTAQVAAYQKAVCDLAPAKEALRRATAAHAETMTALRPAWDRRAELQGKLSAIDHYLETRSLTELAPSIPAQEEELRRREQVRDAVGGAMPEHEALERRLLAALKTAVAAAQRELPNARPSFVPAGIEVSEARPAVEAEIKEFERQTAPQEQELKRRADAISATAVASERAAQAVIDAKQRYLVLRLELQQRFAPAYLAEVRMRAPLDPRSGENVYYHAVVEEPESDLPSVAWLLSALPALNAELGRTRAAFLDAEKRFKDVSDRWQERNARYISITSSEYLLAAELELAEAMISIASEGTPSAVFLELAFRLRDVYAGERTVPYLTLNEELLAYRQAAAEAARTAALKPGEPINECYRTAGPREYLRRRLSEQSTLAVNAGDFGSHQFAEAVDGLGATTFGLFCEQWAKGGGGNLLNGNMGAIMAAYAKEAKVSLASVRKSLEDPVRRRALEEAVGASPARDLMLRASEPIKKAEIAKGFAQAAVLSAAKDGIRNLSQHTQARAQLMTDMALLDIEWFATKVDYQLAGLHYRRYRDMLWEYKARISELLEGQAIAPRQVRVLVDKPFATVDEIQAELRFRGLVKDVDVRSATSAYASSRDLEVREAFQLKLVGGILPAGSSGLHIRASGKSTIFDADPTTPARYAGPTLTRPAAGASLWTGVEEGPDRRHAIHAEAAELAIVDPAGPGYVPGDWVGLSYRLPGSLPYHDLRLELGETEAGVKLDRVVEGRVQVRLPDATEAGDHRPRIVRPSPPGERPRPITQTAAALAVRAPATRGLPGGAFMKVTQTDLPSRGQWWSAPRASAIPAGHGRLHFEPRDAAGQLVSTNIGVFDAAGARKWAGWEAHADLPPGKYLVRMNFYHPPADLSVTVETETAVRVPVGEGYGRIAFLRRDGVGKAADAHVWIRRTGSTEAASGTWAKSLDVPAGTYDVSFSHEGEGTVNNVSQAAVEVKAGKVTTLEAAGYGRLDFEFVDPAGVLFEQHHFLLRVGTDVRIWAGWKRSCDLPPGAYELHYRNGSEYLKAPVTVTGGRSTTYRFNAKP
jgi:hypothetical protein